MNKYLRKKLRLLIEFKPFKIMQIAVKREKKAGLLIIRQGLWL